MEILNMSGLNNRDFVVIFSALLAIYLCYAAPPTTEKFDTFYNTHSVDIIDLHRIKFNIDNNCKECPRIYLPVCANDNQTYTNECVMLCQNVMKKKIPPVGMGRTGICKVFPEW